MGDLVMNDILFNILVISIFAFIIGYNIYCFKKGKYESIMVWSNTIENRVIHLIMIGILILGMIILKPSNLSNNLVVGVVAIHCLILNVLIILIFKKTKKSNIFQMFFYDIFVVTLIILTFK